MREAPWLFPFWVAVACCSDLPEASSQAHSVNRPAQLTRLGANAYAIPRARFNAALARLEQSYGCYAMPAKLDERVGGLQIFGIRRRTLLAEAGLRNGDIIRSINGVALTDAEAVLQLYDNIRQTSHLTVELTRQDVALTFDYRITELEEQPSPQLSPATRPAPLRPTR